MTCRLQIVIVERGGRHLVCRAVGHVLTVEVDCLTREGAESEALRLQKEYDVAPPTHPQVWSAESEQLRIDF